VIDGVDRLTAAERDQLAARLRDAGDDVAVLLTAADATAARMLLAEAGRSAASVVDLRGTATSPAASDETSDTTEVNACDALSERIETK